MNDGLRGTGRTTRMLQKAAWLVLQGKPVVVVMEHPSQARDVVQYVSGVEVISASHSAWHWPEMRMRGYAHDTIYLVDHHALEVRRTSFQQQIDNLNDFEGKQDDLYRS